MKFDFAVLVNLGTPRELSRPACEDFLREFLSAKEVLGLPFIFRKILATFIAKKRAQNYLNTLNSTSIKGLAEFAKHSIDIAQSLQKRLNLPVYWAGVCGLPNLREIAKRIERELGSNARGIFIIQYPQSSSAATFPALRAINEVFCDFKNFKIVSSYCDNPIYINALVKKLKEPENQTDAIIASFHGVPLKSLKLCDYEGQCQKTVSLLREKMPNVRIELAWQSVMNFGDWTAPKTTDLALKLLSEGVKRISVICPGFFCDCTETNVEIAKDLRDTFLNTGGESFEYIPCLNADEMQIDLLESIFIENLR